MKHVQLFKSFSSAQSGTFKAPQVVSIEEGSKSKLLIDGGDLPVDTNMTLYGTDIDSATFQNPYIDFTVSYIDTKSGSILMPERLVNYFLIPTSGYVVDQSFINNYLNSTISNYLIIKYTVGQYGKEISVGTVLTKADFQ